MSCADELYVIIWLLKVFMTNCARSREDVCLELCLDSSFWKRKKKLLTNIQTIPRTWYTTQLIFSFPPPSTNSC